MIFLPLLIGTFDTAIMKSSSVTWVLLSLIAYIPASVHPAWRWSPNPIKNRNYHKRNWKKDKDSPYYFLLSIIHEQMMFAFTEVISSVSYKNSSSHQKIAATAQERKQTLISVPEAPFISSAIVSRSIPRTNFIFFAWTFKIYRRDLKRKKGSISKLHFKIRQKKHKER